MELAEHVALAESAHLPDGDGERFAGYGVMGLPFRSGHVLAMRRFPASSVGPGYTSVWHRSPGGDWAFWQDQPSTLGCGRYFSAAVSSVTQTDIIIDWPSSNQLSITIPESKLRWLSRMESTWFSRGFNLLATALPDRAWRSTPLLRAMGPVVGRALGASPVALAGHAPNGQTFVANPQRIWFVADATATLDGVEFGPPGPLAPQAALGEFAIPQRGIFATGRAFFGRSH